jgi:hypothetical protein
MATATATAMPTATATPTVTAMPTATAVPTAVATAVVVNPTAQQGIVPAQVVTTGVSTSTQNKKGEREPWEKKLCIGSIVQLVRTPASMTTGAWADVDWCPAGLRVMHDGCLCLAFPLLDYMGQLYR